MCSGCSCGTPHSALHTLLVPPPPSHTLLNMTVQQQRGRVCVRGVHVADVHRYSTLTSPPSHTLQVNSSVDVYAFGILMWEMYTAQRPYGSVKQHQLVEEVVMRGLRPKFPPHAPPAYIKLAQSCWSGSPQLRPSFEEALVVLNGMLQVWLGVGTCVMVWGSMGCTPGAPCLVLVNTARGVGYAEVHATAV